MDNDKLLDLAIADLKRQDEYGGTLQKNAQFTLTLGLGVATASIAMFRTELVSDLRLSAIFFWGFGAGVWFYLGWVASLLGQALWSQKMIEPQPIEKFIEWRNTRRQQLEEWEVERTAWEQAHSRTSFRKPPEERANEQMGGQITNDYAQAACHNRTVNLLRQKFIAKATVRVIIAVGFLAGQAVSDCFFLYNRSHNGEVQQPIGRRRTAGTCATVAAPPRHH